MSAELELMVYDVTPPIRLQNQNVIDEYFHSNIFD